MSPKAFQATLAVMAALLFVSFTAVVYGAIRVEHAKQALAGSAFCDQGFYSRDYVAEGAGCQELCTNECSKKGEPLRKSLLISRSYQADRTDVLVSCECTCQGCFKQ